MDLHDHDSYETCNPIGLAYSTEHLSDQFRLAWHDASDIEIPEEYADVDNIVFAGMGGSALAAYLVTSSLHDDITVPYTIVRDYTLPSWVSDRTLVVLLSFSGTTEETISCAAQARKAKAKIMAIATGGDIAALAKKHDYPLYQFVAGDYAQQPRYGLGFTAIGLMAMLSSAGLIDVDEAMVEKMVTAMHDVVDTCAPDVDVADNPAKQVAEELASRAVYVIAAEHLVANANVLANQLNETSKSFSTFFALPELNHHLLEGLKYPASLQEDAVFLMLKSRHYHERIQTRFDITADLMEAAGLTVIEYDAHGKNRLEEMAEILQWSGYVGWYTAIGNDECDGAIPTVVELKKRLAKS